MPCPRRQRVTCAGLTPSSSASRRCEPKSRLRAWTFSAVVTGMTTDSSATESVALGSRDDDDQGRLHRGGVARLKRAPFVAGLAISLADPGGPIEAIKETSATLKTVSGAAESGTGASSSARSPREVIEEARHRKNPLVRLQAQGRARRAGDPRRAARRQRDRHGEGHAGGGRRLPRLAAGGREGVGRRGEGGRLPRLPRRAGQRGRAAHARPARRRARPGAPERRDAHPQAGV